MAQSNEELQASDLNFQTPEGRKSFWLNIFSVWLGTTMEYVDFALYGLAAGLVSATSSSQSKLQSSLYSHPSQPTPSASSLVRWAPLFWAASATVMDARSSWLSPSD